MAKTKKKVERAVSVEPAEPAVHIEVPKGRPVPKVARALALYDGLTLQGEKPKVIFKKIGEELKVSERVARSYVWRAKNPEKFKALLARYFEKRKAKMKAKAEAGE